MKKIPEMLCKGISGIFHLIVYGAGFRECDIITESELSKRTSIFLKGGTNAYRKKQHKELCFGRTGANAC